MKTVILVSALLFLSDNAHAQSFQVLNPKVEQGGVLVFKIASRWMPPELMPPAVQNPSIAIFGKHYLPNKYGDIFIGIDRNIAPGTHMAILVEYGQGVRLSWDYKEVEVVERNFVIRARSPGAPRNPQEVETIDKAYKSGDKSEKYFESEFVRPLNLMVLDKDRTIGDISNLGQFGGESHRGVDLITLDPKTKKYKWPVKAINSGRVVLVARNFSLEGNMIIIDHGSGVFSLYMHLSKFNVKQSQLVKAGDVIGISGKSGRVTGPHLHLAVRVGDPFDPQKFVVVDPLAFINDFNKYVDR